MLDWLSAWYEKRTARTKKTIVLVAGLSGVSIFYLLGRFVLPLQGPDEGLFTEIVGILITVLLFGRWIAINDQERYKKSLIRQARSRANSNAIDAIETIREEGWLEEEGISLLEGRNLSGADLSGVNLRNAYLLGTQFNGKAKLDRADFSGSHLGNAQFIGAQLSETVFVSADLVGADFREATLEKCQFKVNRETYDENDAQLRNNETEAVFERSILKSVTFEGMSLDNISFKDAQIEDVNFNSAHLYKADFSGVRFTKTEFFDAYLERADFSKSNTSDIRSFKKAILHSTDFKECAFIGTRLDKAELKGAFCNETIFQRCNLQGTIFETAILIDATFIEVEFDGDTILPNGKTCRTIWAECVDACNSNQEAEVHFRDLVMRYLLDEVRMKTIDKSFYLVTADYKIRLDTAEFRLPKTHLPTSPLDDELLNQE